MKVSKEVKKLRFYESTLLSAYKVRYIIKYFVFSLLVAVIYSKDSYVPLASLLTGFLKILFLLTEDLYNHFQAYVQKLVALQQQTVYRHVATRCLCTLLAAVPHFNYRESLLAAVVKDISSQDDVVR